MLSLTAGGSCLFVGLRSSQRVTRRCIGLADALEDNLSLAFATFAAERAFHFGPCQDDRQSVLRMTVIQSLEKLPRC